MERYRFILKISCEEIHAYSILSGDKNPIHVDQLAAKQAGFKNIVAHGLLVQSKIISRLGSLFQLEQASIQITCTFLLPVYAEELLEIEVISTVQEIKFKGTIQLNEVVRGIIKKSERI